MIDSEDSDRSVDVEPGPVTAGEDVADASGAQFAGKCESAECALREFTREVEDRLDAKLDRLERLLKAADRVLCEYDAESGAALRDGLEEGVFAQGVVKRPLPAGRHRLHGDTECHGADSHGAESGATGEDGAIGSADSSPSGSVEVELGTVTSAERERVLALAAGGKSPEAISETVGLVRGEVDLILRLYGRETPARG